MLKQQVDAIYENGLFRPLAPIDLAEHEQVSLVIRTKGDSEDDDAVDAGDYMPLIAEDGDPDITWEQVQAALANIPGSFADDIIRERDERF